MFCSKQLGNVPTFSGLEKRNGLDSFTSFYLPKVATNKNPGKRDGLSSFSSFYRPKEVDRSGIVLYNDHL